MGRQLLCVAEGRDGDWEAICLDLDIAVQGESFDEVKHLLDGAVQTYLEDARKEDAQTRKRLLARTVPFGTRLAFVCKLAVHALFGRYRHDGLQASFEIPCHA